MHGVLVGVRLGLRRLVCEQVVRVYTRLRRGGTKVPLDTVLAHGLDIHPTKSESVKRELVLQGLSRRKQLSLDLPAFRWSQVFCFPDFERT